MKDYKRKSFSKAQINAVKFFFRKYPNFINAIKNMHLVYNETLELINKKELAQKIFVIRPSKMIDIFILDKYPNIYQKIYDLGFNDAKNKMNDLMKYLSEVKLCQKDQK